VSTRRLFDFSILFSVATLDAGKAVSPSLT
jgi:hypothetical protein